MRLTEALCSRYFKRYVEREMYAGSLRRQWRPLVGWREIKKRDWYYNEHRPWTEDFKRANAPGIRTPKIYVEPIKEWKLFKGDRVEILVGKDKGKQGIINCIIKERNWCFVEGLNCEYKMQSQNPAFPPVCVKNELPLMVTSQVRLLDPSDSEPTEVDWRYTEEGLRVRVSTRTGRVIPVPSQGKMLDDFVVPNAYVDNPATDTLEKDLVEVTFDPKLCTFEEDIMQDLGIQEYRKPVKTYWY